MMRTFVGRWYGVLIAQRRAQRARAAQAEFEAREDVKQAFRSLHEKPAMTVDQVLKALKVGAVLVILAGCQSVPVAGEKPQPPNVSQCQQHRTPNLDPAPMFFWQLPEYLATAVYTLAEERRLRRLEQACIAGMKAEGAVR
jgi:hypothetical protein